MHSTTVIPWFMAVVVATASVVSANLNTLIPNGPSGNRVDIVFLGDGYTAGEQINAVYPQHVQAFIDYTFLGNQQPFPRYQSFFNVHTIDVVSNESGADIPPDDVFVDTALNARYYFDNQTERLLYISNFKASQIINSALSGTDITAEMKVVTVNSTKYGGGGGNYAVYAGGNSLATEIALHEIGHQFADLADEYVSFSTPYTGSEPSEANVTTNPAGKWDLWLGYVDPDFPELGPVGVYEGARYHPTGIYRPTQNSKMRSLNRPFDAISREQIIRRIYELVDPIDTHLPNTGTLIDPGALTVEVIDEEVIDLTWSIQGQTVTPLDPSAFDPSLYGYGLGTFEVSALAADNTPWVRTPEIKDLLSQEVLWTVTLTEPATDLDGTGILDADDIDLAISKLNAGGGFDLDGSGTADPTDIDFLLAEMIGTAFGDGNLDGRVNLEDLSTFADLFGQQAYGWSNYDFNLSGVIDLEDLSLLANNWGFNAGQQGTPIPTPATAAPLILGFATRHRPQSKAI